MACHMDYMRTKMTCDRRWYAVYGVNLVLRIPVVIKGAVCAENRINVLIFLHRDKHQNVFSSV